MNGVSKLVLGTVQFGCSYGVNSAGRPDFAEVSRILDLAHASGITTLDTSSAYGDAEQVIGNAGACRFNVVSKYPKGSGNVADAFSLSLARIGVPRLHGYMLHHFELWRENPGIWDDFRRLRDSGLTERIGFSLYSPDELEMLLSAGVDFDLLQFPRNLLDRRFDPYLPGLKGQGVEIHVRSTFLQGLFFMDRNSLPEKLSPLRPSLEQIDSIARDKDLDVSALALAFNLLNPLIDGVLVGVDNCSQLQADIDDSEADCWFDFDIEVSDRALLNPVNWK